MLFSDQFPQDMMGKNPLDMDQYKRIFGTCRIPMQKRDKLVYNSNSRHIIVLHNNHVSKKKTFIMLKLSHITNLSALKSTATATSNDLDLLELYLSSSLSYYLSLRILLKFLYRSPEFLG